MFIGNLFWSKIILQSVPVHVKLTFLLDFGSTNLVQGIFGPQIGPRDTCAGLFELKGSKTCKLTTKGSTE